MMSAVLIDGKAQAEVLRARVAAGVAAFREGRGFPPGLAVVLVGDDPASQVYVRSKIEQSQAIGMHSVNHRLGSDASQAELMALIESLNADSSIHGILLQLPLPPGLDAGPILARLDPAKDVDGLTPTNAGLLAAGAPALTPCTPLGCRMLLQEAVGELRGKRALVIGRSMLVGRPVASLLLDADCTVTIAHSRTRDLPDVCRESEILIAAVGRPEMVQGDWIRPGAAVIDVGINRVPAKDPARAAAGRTRLVGDVAFAEAREIAGWITPVPGGVGPMTVACLLHNTLIAAGGRLGEV
ncbi:MAG TPA: bifunctional methylenetetrahydrofolate dehydrogenase/methenyltetrahydrofolate cyclohydrolase FolD [Caulobacteraceae bacterium]|nr:bifunctional methylenetetrahydrofolate dehydrogenase/methenyltetrahydrofolate cyclohydrolase FolD [Caulobacteraceae bacterium]